MSICEYLVLFIFYQVLHQDHPDVKVKRKTVVWQKRRLQQPTCSAAFLQLGSHSKAQALKLTEPLIILTGHCPYLQSVPAGRN